MDSDNKATHPLRRLTKKQLAFIRSYFIEGRTQADAYRTSYNTLASPRGVAAQAYRLLRTTRIREAMSHIQDGSLSAEFILTDPALLSIQKRKKLYAIAENARTPGYVALQALALAQYEDSKVRNPQNKPETAEEIDRMLAEAMKDSRYASGHSPTGEDHFDELEDFSAPPRKQEPFKRFGSGRESPQIPIAPRPGHVRFNR